MKFILEINLTVNTDPADVAESLIQVADILRCYGFSEGIESSTIMDPDTDKTWGKWRLE